MKRDGRGTWPWLERAPWWRRFDAKQFRRQVRRESLSEVAEEFADADAEIDDEARANAEQDGAGR